MDMITSINASSYTVRASMNTTVRTESAEKTEFMSEDAKLEAFKKEVWKEVDAMPWNSCMNTSVQISDKAFKRMMNDKDFKDRMISSLHREAVGGRPPGDTTLIWVNEDGLKAFAYLDIEAGHQAFAAHSRHKDSFFAKKAKAKEVNYAWEQAQLRRDKQREIREEEYWNKYYARKALAHQEQVANLYYDNVPVVDTVSPF
ncbi:MAG: hypothetical protein J6X94_01265 [Lachnospiraceae bacterium]|nr:hypothetical protein [Lachnospiraceae bacterium]